jgi:GNAT superfamily N-acetyltransferase
VGDSLEPSGKIRTWHWFHDISLNVVNSRKGPRAMIGDYSIRLARPDDLALLQVIELAAARLLVGQAPAAVLEEASSMSVLEAACARGHLWVAVANDGRDLPVGFAHVLILEPWAAHLHELDVHPDHGRRGVGTALVRAVCAWAAAERYRAVTLSTFRDVPFNMPFYESLGFAEVAPQDFTPGLVSVLEDWRQRGLDVAPRVVMSRPSDSTVARIL